MIEILESRIAPAAVFYYTDVDGDHVKISSTVGTDTELAAAVTLSNSGVGVAAVGKPHVLEMLSLGHEFAGASISITATPSNDLNPLSKTKSGDGFANVGEINAPLIDLKTVSVHGDLGQIVVGDNNLKHEGLGSLSVQSMGDFGLTTGANSLLSRFENGVGSIKIAHDADGVLLRATATGQALTAKIGSVYIGGDLIGINTNAPGAIDAVNGIGSVKIMGNVIGGSDTQTGRISAATGNIGSIYVHGNFIGGSAQSTGIVFTTKTIGSIIVKGGLLGGSAESTGGVDAGSIGLIEVGSGLTGGTFSSTTDVDHSAYIRAQDNIKSAIIGGGLTAGTETGGGAMTFSAAVQAGGAIGSLKVEGSIVGSAGDAVVISGEGPKVTYSTTTNKPLEKHDVAIGSLVVEGSATYAQILAGYDIGSPSGPAISPKNGDAQIGSVKIGGDLIASDIIAGVKTAAGDTNFGLATDSAIGLGTPAATDGIYSTIASIVVGGEIEGTNATVDMFGIEAQYIVSIKSGGLALPLTKGPGNDGFLISPQTARDVHVNEVGGT
jgi:hypothetical protein